MLKPITSCGVLIGKRPISFTRTYPIRTCDFRKWKKRMAMLMNRNRIGWPPPYKAFWLNALALRPFGSNRRVVKTRGWGTAEDTIIIFISFPVHSRSRRWYGYKSLWNTPRDKRKEPLGPAYARPTRRTRWSGLSVKPVGRSVLSDRPEVSADHWFSQQHIGLYGPVSARVRDV